MPKANRSWWKEGGVEVARGRCILSLSSYSTSREKATPALRVPRNLEESPGLAGFSIINYFGHHIAQNFVFCPRLSQVSSKSHLSFDHREACSSSTRPPRHQSTTTLSRPSCLQLLRAREQRGSPNTSCPSRIPSTDAPISLIHPYL